MYIKIFSYIFYIFIISFLLQHRQTCTRCCAFTVEIIMVTSLDVINLCTCTTQEVINDAHLIFQLRQYMYYKTICCALNETKGERVFLTPQRHLESTESSLRTITKETRGWDHPRMATHLSHPFHHACL